MATSEKKVSEIKAVNVDTMSFAELAALQQRINETISVKRDNELTAFVLRIKAECDTLGFKYTEVGARLNPLPPMQVTRAQRRDEGADDGSSKLKGREVAAKYRDPVTGDTWSGRGLSPKWLRAHIAAGRTKEEFLIQH